jgi:hypothetical protein
MGTNDKRSGRYRGETEHLTDRPLPRFNLSAATVTILGSHQQPAQSPAQLVAAQCDTTSELALLRRRKRDVARARGPTTNAFVGKYD